MAVSEEFDTSLGKVLVVEDEKSLAHLVAVYLARTGFTVVQAHSGVQAFYDGREWDRDVVVLYLGLPGVAGLEVCCRLRSFSECCILILTARGSEDDKLAGLGAGADDYITKPFSVRELVARVQAVLRRPRTGTAVAQHETQRVFGDLVVDLAAHKARVDDAVLALTRTEFSLLVALSAQPTTVMSRRQLIDAVWDTSWVGDERVVDVHIGTLRREPAEPRPGGEFIATVRGVGSRMGSA